MHPIFMTDALKTFTHAILRAENTKMRIFSFMLQKETETIRTFIPTVHSEDSAKLKLFHSHLKKKKKKNA